MYAFDLSLPFNGELDSFVLPCDCNTWEYKAEKREVVMILQIMRTFEFAFSIHLMRNILGITCKLSSALQRKNQGIVNVIDLLKIAKQRFQKMRCDEWIFPFKSFFMLCPTRLIEVLPAQKYRISEHKNKGCKVLNSTAIASSYAGRDPQGGTSDGSFLLSSLLYYKEWLKIFF